MATALAPTTGSSTVRWVDCSHKLGSLPCMNHKPHEGGGRGCVPVSYTHLTLPTNREV